MKGLKILGGLYAFLAVIISIIAAVTETILFIIGYFTSMAITLYIALFIAIICLIALILNLKHGVCGCNKLSYCAKPISKCFVIGVIGTIASVAIALSTHMTNIAQSTIVMIGLSAFAFSLMIISFVIISFLYISNRFFMQD